MSTPNVQLVMLPIPDWKVARVIRFRFKHHLCDCGGTIVYTRPFTITYKRIPQIQLILVFLQRYRISILMCKLITKTLYGTPATLTCKRFMMEVDLKQTLLSE